jgi:hypothetical protein
LKNFTNCSYGEKVFGLGIFHVRVPLAHTPNQAVLQDHLVQQVEDIIRLKKERGHHIRKDDGLFEGNENESWWYGITFCFVEIFHKKLLLVIETQKILYEKGGICQRRSKSSVTADQAFGETQSLSPTTIPTIKPSRLIKNETGIILTP